MVRRERMNSKKPVKDYLSKDDIVLSGDNLDDEEPVPEKAQNHKDQQLDNHKSGTQKLFDFRQYIDCMNPEEQERLNVKFIRAIFSSDAPLSILGNEAIEKSTAIGVHCDGRSNRRNESIVNFVVTTPETMLYKTKNTKAELHTGEYMAQLILEVINEVGAEKVLIVVTDAARHIVSIYWRKT
ncbi:uncharacterized protein LOC117176634 [Belonocnema kinseyi]|uniref:uncharacterized protein LOC117176634 n=1 Tax=Belonocnema kinseyi TaxID=2817044 RepID=UPI00143D09E2|nr:uncharacterized protein LOC117176634 [Belonocnema kinseyi]